MDDGQYLDRPLEAALAAALADTPVVCLLGPRQCGKSTLAGHLAPGRPYFTLDDDNLLRIAQDDPPGFVAELPERVTIDEVQRAPELLLAIKRSVDTQRRPGRFLLTGSANLLQLPRLADSLAGRMECIHLQPFSEMEKEQQGGNFVRDWLRSGIDAELRPSGAPQASDLPRRIVAGGFPEAFKRSPERARRWQRQYLRSIIERDVQDIAQIKDSDDLARLLEYLAHHSGKLLNVAESARTLAHTRATIDHYLSVLERLFLIRRLPAWHRNNAKRLVKTPKVHICDSGFAAALAGLQAEHWTTDRGRFGHLVESFVLQQLMVQADWFDDDLRFWHYRDKDKVEVDVVITDATRVWGAEVKAGKTVSQRDGSGLRRLAAQAGKPFQSGVIFYDGDSVLPISAEPRIHAVPIGKLWGA